MATIVIYIILGINAVISLANPWVGVVLTYFMTVLTPHNIWWWAFEDIRPIYYFLLPALAGFVILVIRRNVNLYDINTSINWCIGILWICFSVSFYFGPYVNVFNEYRFYDPHTMFSGLQKTYLTYFIGVALINSRKKLMTLSMVIIVTLVIMTYWANAQYLVHHKLGRIHGPTPPGGSSIYFDENNFAVLFVVGFPLLYYFGVYLNNVIIKYLTWILIPFSWHAVFLTASRGALLATLVILLVFIWRNKKKSIGYIVLLIFIAAFIWQAGDITKSRTLSTISNEEGVRADSRFDESSASRVDAWNAAIKMMKAYPFTGVGIASFGQAFPAFSDKIPRIAHNTFFQIGGEYGVIAGITFLFLMLSTLNCLRKNGTKLQDISMTNQEKVYYYLNEGCLLGLTGFFVCSLFLSLEKYEILYYLLILCNGTLIGSTCVIEGKKI